MPKKIRVYELARELGLENKEALDLCLSLGIGVKSHSSSVEDAQADRVRRKAEREGLKRDPIPEPEPAKPEPAAEKKPVEKRSPEKKVAEKKAADKPGDDDSASSASESADKTTSDGPVGEPDRPSQAEEPGKPRLIRSSPTPPPPPPPPPRAVTPPRAVPPRPVAPPVAEKPAAKAPAAAAPVTTAPAASAPAGDAPAASAPAASAPESSGPESNAPVVEPTTTAPAADVQAAASGADAPPRPVSPTGKPIPPPPGARRPVGPSGKPIPPPPGAGGRKPPPGAPRPMAPGVRGRAGYSPPPGGPRPGGGGPGGPRPGGPGGPGGGPGGRGGVGPPGGRFGGPGTRGGPGGRGRPQQRSRRRRRRTSEELEQPNFYAPYVPSDLPVPDGEIIIERGSTARELGPKLNRSAADVVRFLLQQGEMVTANQPLSDDAIELFAAEVGGNSRLVDPGEEKEAELQARYFEDDDDEDDDEDLAPRPPVITVMGHVDHGKTLLLDRIREADVVSGEAGGITQHIGAYQAEHNGRLITFIDTPGHEAFTAMRARGAQVTDIAVLVVAADDGVMPQTIEAINHAKAADVPIVVAVNKIDREDADPNRVKQQLSEHGLVPEDWGGDTAMVEVSALQKLGIDDLLEHLVLVADIEELGANPDCLARGTVLEGFLDPGRGPMATVIVERGTLKVGDPVVMGSSWGRVRALLDHRGVNTKAAGPSTPVQVLGLSEVPTAGDELRVTPDDKTARTIADLRSQRYRANELRRSPQLPAAAPGAAGAAKLEDIFEQIQRGETATLNLVLKADVHGSLEALTESLQKLEREDVKLNFVHRAVGGIIESDVQLASASQATVIGFNVRPDRKARDLAESQDVEVRTYEIIYQVLEEIEAAMVGMLKPEYEEVVTGDAEVLKVFGVPRIGKIAGCAVRNGVITRGSKVRFLRDGVIIWKGAISSLRREKDDVREVRQGFECGIGLTDFQNLQEGDVIETYEDREIPRV